MPVFSQLDYNDQEALLKQAVLANAILLEAFYSCQMNSEICIMPNGYSPIKVSVSLCYRFLRCVHIQECNDTQRRHIERNDGTDEANFLPNNGGNVPNSDDYGRICIAQSYHLFALRRVFPHPYFASSASHAGTHYSSQIIALSLRETLPTFYKILETMHSVNHAHLNTNASGPNTSHESLSSGSSSKALATSVDSLEYLTFTSSELQNGQLKPKNFARGVEMPTKCLVCGHPTNCCNYGVASCNGCRAFFRRSFLECKTYECKLNGMCSRMHGINRCRACRFDRCVLVGMDPRTIQFPASVDMAKFSGIVANRRRYLSQKYGERCPVLIGKTSPVFEETIESKTIQSLVYVELKVRQIRESSRWLSESVMFRSIRELLSSQENVLVHADQYPKELTWPLTFDEALRIEAGERRPRWIMLDIFLCIEMARTMPVFSQLEYNDQEALLKEAILTNTILLAAFYSSQMKSETLIMPNGFVPIKVSSRRTMATISRIQMTMEEFVLLKAVIYSHSAIHGISERGRVLLEKESIRYSKTLMKHLQSRMGAAPGAKKFAELVSFVGCLFQGAQQMREIHVYMSTVMGASYGCPPYMETIMRA
ncbi:ligand-binding domain of nuclear hormone receptor domain-containing protein [Ditylenchus destructor]|uniref:Ligand-binding domain of nuclear hormone receptor domain-containing protein n=1 Tax=Ditylenchus destructor TaxID=166010 RepID=A0AAD4MPM8_9BILA|nr:ligand-binding domain of nuclear hormone receptor domain-containing protein [Ditylenchus destructor]